MTAPRFSIVIPTYRRHVQLHRCLEGLARLSYRRDDFEVIVVDDGSGDPPSTTVEAFRGRMDVALRVSRWGGPGSARNHGVESARGEYLAFIDDDCHPTPDWLSLLERHLLANGDVAVGGRTINALPANPYASASQLLVSYLYDYYGREGNQRRRYFATNNLALRAGSFRQIGGFDTVSLADTAEDRDLCDRWLGEGRTLVYAPDAIVYHEHRLTFTSFCRQHFRYGRGAPHFHRARARRGAGDLNVEPPAFYLGLLATPATEHAGFDAARLTALLATTQISYALGYITERLIGEERRGATTRVAAREHSAADGK